MGQETKLNRVLFVLFSTVDMNGRPVANVSGDQGIAQAVAQDLQSEGGDVPGGD